MAGPETALALGQPDLTADELAAGQQTASAPLAPLGPIGGAQQAQQRSSGGQVNFGLQQPQLNPQRAYSAQEFYPGQERPAHYQASGGDPLFVPSAGRIPFGIIADRAAQLQKQKDELSSYFRKQQDQFSGTAAPQYERDYQAWAGAQHDDFVQSYADQYTGGNVNDALKAIYKDPKANAMYRKRMADVKAAGIANKFYTTQAQDYIDGVMSGEVDPDPELLKEAQWFTSGAAEFGPNSDSAALRADHAKTWDKLVSRDKLFTNFYAKELANAEDAAQAAGKISWRNGVRVIDETLKKDYDRFIDRAAKEMTHKYGTGTYEENKKFLEARLGQYKVTNTTAAPQPSSGGAVAKPADKVWTSPVQVNMANTNTGGGLVETVSADGVKRRTPAVQSISVGNVVDGRQEQFSKPVQFKQGNTPVKMIWTGIDRGADGSIMLVGYDPASTDTNTNVDDLNVEIGDLSAKIREDEKYGTPANGETEEEFKARVADQKKRRSDLLAKVRSVEKSVQKRMVPLKGNEGVADGLLGGRLQQELAKFGGAQAPATKPAQKTTADPLGIL